MVDFLDRMADFSRTRVERAQELVPLARVRERALARPCRDLVDMPFHLFAEVKPGSPSEGSLTDADPLLFVPPYCESGATSLSVLTEPSAFGGSLALLQRVSEIATIPVMRKDFIVDPYQVWEARAFGADGVLVIARMFQHRALHELIDVAAEAGVFVLLEIFEASDLALIGSLDASEGNLLLGVNCRDLKTLEVRAERHHDIIGEIPQDFVTIAESGIASPERVSELVDMGYGGVLVGTALMRAVNPSAMVMAMRHAGEGALK